MKKILLAVLTLALAACAFACSSTKDSAGLIKYYSVTFVQTGQPDVIKAVEEGKSLSQLPSVKPETGYTIVWEEKNLSGIKSNITVNAVRTANEYTVTYDANGGTVEPATQKITYDSNYTLATPARDGRTFVVWKNGDASVTVTGTWKTASDVTLKAKWNELATYTVTFVQDGQPSVEKTVEQGGSLAAADIPVPVSVSGYTVAWNRTDFNDITENITVEAVKTANEYTVTYDANGGAVNPVSQKVTFAADYTLAVPSREGFTFVAWKNGDNAVASSGKWETAADVALKAEWQQNVPEQYTVSFVQDGQTIAVKTAEAGGNLAAADIPAPVSVTGYTVAWDRTEFTDINENITVNAVKTAKNYTVTYDANGGAVSPASQKVTFDADYSLAVPSRLHFTFVAWKNGDNAVASSGKWKIASDVTLVAQWTENAKYTVTFVQDGKSDVTREVYVGETLTDIPAPAAVKGYDVKWNVTDFSKITASATVTAIATAKTYTINYELGTLAGDSNAHISATSQSVQYDASFNLLTPSCEGYYFKGWVIKGTSTAFVNGKYKLTDNVTLVALWEEASEDDRWWTKFY